MARIFISYRRDDAAGYSHLLFERLSRYFGRNSIFMDVDTLEPGVDFAMVIERAVVACDTLICVIGTRWLTIVDEHGQRRLDQPDDYIRLEVGTALAQGIRVIPVLVLGARMPSADELPEPLKPLARRNAIALSNERVDYDMQRLIATLIRASGARSWLDRLEAQPETTIISGPAKQPTPEQVARPRATRLLFEPEMVQIPAGEFLAGEFNERVTLPEFWISKYPVKVGEFRAFVDGGGYENPDYWTAAGWAWRKEQNRTAPEFWDDKRWTGNEWQPVVGVSWYEAYAYGRWLAEKTRWPYRLPTSLEWEKAARGIDGRTFPWGDELRHGMANIYGTGVACTTQVGMFSPDSDSPYGVADLIGNVSEWTQTIWTPRGDNETHPEGTASRVRHGGSWSSVKLVPAHARIRGAPDFVSNYVGVRVVRSVPEYAPVDTIGGAG